MDKLTQAVIGFNERIAKLALDVDLEYVDLIKRLGVQTFRIYRPWL